MSIVEIQYTVYYIPIIYLLYILIDLELAHVMVLGLAVNLT